MNMNGKRFRFEVRNVSDNTWGNNTPRTRKETLQFLQDCRVPSNVRRRLTTLTEGHTLSCGLGCNLVAHVRRYW